jgi:hypothetical protein
VYILLLSYGRTTFPVPVLSGASNTQSEGKAVNFYTFLSEAVCSYKYEQSAYITTPSLQHVTAFECQPQTLKSQSGHPSK